MTETVALDKSLSGTVEAVIRQLKEDWVPAVEVIDAIMGRHRRDYAGGLGRELIPTMKDLLGARSEEAPARLPPTQWLDQAAPALRGELWFGRLVIVGLALIDPPTGWAAERSGLLWRIATEIEPDLSGFLTPLGIRLLRRRLPLTAAGLGLLEPAEVRRGYPETGPAVDVAFPLIPSGRGGVGRYACAWRESVEIVRDGISVSRVEDLPHPRLAWYGKDTLLVGHENGIKTLGREQQDLPQWGRVDRLAVSRDLIAVVAEGRLLVGQPDVERPEPVRDQTHEVVDVAAAWDREVFGVVHTEGSVALYDLEQESWVTPEAADAPPPPPAVCVAMGPDDLVIVGRADAWVDVYRSTKYLRSVHLAAEPPSERVGAVAAGPDGLAAAAVSTHNDEDQVEGLVTVFKDGVEIARLRQPAPVNAVALSRDGRLLGTAAGDGFVRFWQLRPDADLRLGGYSADDTSGADLVGISGTVDALAALLTAKEVVPPVSVGLFGAWGAGKTFFMQRLRARVEEIVGDARASRRRQGDLWAWRNVSQIWFNAWSYASADVWAGLIVNLLRELGQGTKLLRWPEQLEQRRLQRLEELMTLQQQHNQALGVRSEAEQARTRAALIVEQRKQDLAAAQQAAKEARAAADDQTVKESLRNTAETALAALGIGVASPALSEVEAALRRGRETLTSGRALLAERAGRRRLVLALLVGPVVALVAGVAAQLVQPSLTGLASWTAGAAAAVQALVAWSNRQLQWAQKQLDKIQAAEAEVAKDVAARQQAVVEAERALTERAAEVEAAQREVDLAEHRLASAEERVAQATPAGLLRDYIAERAASEDYRRQLGLVGMVREDLDVISQAIAWHNRELETDPQTSADDKAINRIVVYVDDLDRCPPHVVVRVLEAVHLLLSYPTFVVVAAVDPQWVSRSLATVYPQMFAGEGVTPEDYLEKIFQLPVWLDPLGRDAALQMVIGLLGGPVGSVSPAKQDGGGPDRERTEPGTGEPSSPRTGTGAVGTQAPVLRENLATSRPEHLVLSEEEQKGVEALAPLLIRSPRALKRYLNTYRLLRARLTESHDLDKARFLLAVTTARPTVGARILESIATVSSEAPDTLLGELVDTLDRDGSAWLDGLEHPWREWRCGDVAAVVPEVRRYTFRLTRPTESESRESLLETLQGAEPPTSGSSREGSSSTQSAEGDAGAL